MPRTADRDRIEAHFAPAGIRALLVEDDDVDAKLIGHFAAAIDQPPLRLTRVSSTEDGKKQLAARRFDLCILDFWLGCESSLRFLADLDALPGAPPAIVLTSLDTPEIGDMCRRAGARAQLGKGRLDAATLRGVVLDALATPPPAAGGADRLESLCDLLDRPMLNPSPQGGGITAFDRRDRARDRLAGLWAMSETARFAQFEALIAMQAHRGSRALSFATLRDVVDHGCGIAGVALAARGQTLVVGPRSDVHRALPHRLHDPAPLLFLLHDFICQVGARSVDGCSIEATTRWSDAGLSFHLDALALPGSEPPSCGPLAEALLAGLAGSVGTGASDRCGRAAASWLHLARVEPGPAAGGIASGSQRTAWA